MFTSHVFCGFHWKPPSFEASPEGDLRLQDILNHNVAGLGGRAAKGAVQHALHKKLAGENCI